MNYIYYNNSKLNANKGIYTFLDVVKKYIDVDIYYSILNNEDDYKLKNIWNVIVREWKISQNYIENIKKSDNTDKYIKESYNYIHTIITDQEINDLFNLFINGDEFKAIYCINCILKYN